MNALEKVRAEVERRIEIYSRYEEKLSRVIELKSILSFIDSLTDEPVAEDLEKYASRAGFDYVDNIVQEHPGHRWNDHDVEFAFRDGIIAGAYWQADQFEKNRLAACDKMTKEEYDRETEFSLEIINKEHRQPTFSDAIEYGMRIQREQMMKDAVEGEVYRYESYKRVATAILVDIPKEELGDKVRVLIVKEDDNSRITFTD